MASINPFEKDTKDILCKREISTKNIRSLPLFVLTTG